MSHERARTAAPRGWKAMDDFAAGIDGNRLPRTGALVGEEFRLAFEDGASTDLRFTGDTTVEWATAGPNGTSRSSTDWYEAIAVRDELLFVDQTYAASPYRSAVTVMNRVTGRALTVVSTIAEGPVPDAPRVSQSFVPGVIVGGGPGRPNGPVPAPTRDLVGWRALYRYSPQHLYEHVYLSSERYCWQCLVGVQRGHGDVDLATTWKYDEDLYVFTFREFRIPVAATWLYDLDALRSTGKFFGLTGSGRVANSPGGALITPLGWVEYPDGEQPV